MSASSTQSVILYAFLGRRVVPGKKCETKREQRREVMKVRRTQRNIFMVGASFDLGACS